MGVIRGGTDGRRNCSSGFAAKPTASIPGVCDGWAETIGADRFFGNEEVEGQT